MRIIKDGEVTKSLQLRDIIDGIENILKEEGIGGAVNAPRIRFGNPISIKGQSFMGNVIGGSSSALNLAALRYDASIMRLNVDKGLSKRGDFVYPDGKSYGFVILSDTRSGKPLSIIHDFRLSPIRVAATTGVAVKFLSRKDSSILGLFGSGNEAQKNAEAITMVRNIKKVIVYSPNKAHRDLFCKRMDGTNGAVFESAPKPFDAVKDADIVMCATNSVEPVFRGEWLSNGQTVITIGASDVVMKRREADDLTFQKSDTLVLNSIQAASLNRQSEILRNIKKMRRAKKNIVELKDVVSNISIGRIRKDEIVYYNSNVGFGTQFVVVCNEIFKKCIRNSWGTEIDDDLFGSDISEWVKQGFMPSP
jgi:ornithine cyclodeaminase/alanine dehydrogenase-like protein (mu-crystallin family)